MRKIFRLSLKKLFDFFEGKSLTCQMRKFLYDWVKIVFGLLSPWDVPLDQQLIENIPSNFTIYKGKTDIFYIITWVDCGTVEIRKNKHDFLQLFVFGSKKIV